MKGLNFPVKRWLNIVFFFFFFLSCSKVPFHSLRRVLQRFTTSQSEENKWPHSILLWSVHLQHNLYVVILWNRGQEYYPSHIFMMTVVSYCLQDMTRNLNNMVGTRFAVDMSTWWKIFAHPYPCMKNYRQSMFLRNLVEILYPNPIQILW